MKKRIKRISIFFVILITLFFCLFLYYINDYYHADMELIATFNTSDIVKKSILDDNTIVYSVDNVNTGLIFYPGGKVEYTAYEPMMRKLASECILCILVKMPLNLAVFDINAADGIQTKFSYIDNWYIGGHSLGGAMAASYLSNNSSNFDGLILLGSYTTSDLSQTNINIISIYGSEDKILNRKKYNERKSNLSTNFFEYIIDGGCHSYFCVYGMQDGDGTPTISNEQQITLSSDLISKFILNN